jgi:hypothetical protein
MRSVIGPLLFGLIPLLAVGCALPDRCLSRSEDLRFRPNGLTNSRRSQITASNSLPEFGSSMTYRESIKNDSDSTSAESGKSINLVNFKAEKKTTSPQKLFAGHSFDLDQSTDVTESDSSPSAFDGLTSNNGKSIAKQQKVGPATNQGSFSDTDSETPTVNHADYRIGDDQKKPRVELVGLEEEVTESPFAESRSTTADESSIQSPARNINIGQDEPIKMNPPSSVQMWADRPKDRSPEIPQDVKRPDSKNTSPAQQVSQKELSRAPTTPKSTAVLPLLPWQADLEQLIARVERDLASTKPEPAGNGQSEYLRKHAHLRLLYLMAQRQEEALTAIPGVETYEQEYWQQLIWAMSNSLDTVQFPEVTDRAAQTVPPLAAALRQMREQSALSIKNMTFCRKISYFGNYERFPRNEFTPGHEVLLYTEIENFISAPTVDGEYRTSLKSLIEITDSKGKIVWTKSFPSTEDFCRNPRRDYFHNYQFYIPEDLSTGAYVLKLTIVDELSRKRVSNSLNFVLK